VCAACTAGPGRAASNAPAAALGAAGAKRPRAGSAALQGVKPSKRARASLGPGPATPQLAPGGAPAPAPPSGGVVGDPGHDPSPTGTASGASGPVGAAAAAAPGGKALTLPDPAMASPPSAGGSAGAAPRFGALSPLLDLEGLAATPRGAPMGFGASADGGGAPAATEADALAAAAGWGHEPGGLAAAHACGMHPPSAGAQMRTPPQQVRTPELDAQRAASGRIGCNQMHFVSAFQSQHSPCGSVLPAWHHRHSRCSNTAHVRTSHARRLHLCAWRCTATAVGRRLGRVWVREAPPAQGPPADPALTPGSSRWARGVLASGGGAAGARARLEHDAAPASAPASPPDSGGAAAAAAAAGRSGGEQRLLMEGPGYAVRA